MRKFILTALLLTNTAYIGAAHAEHWTKIDFDADLRTMLIDTDSIQHNGTHVTLTELQVEGRTAPTRGDQFHTLVGRDFDCTAGSSVVTSVRVFPTMKSKGTTLAIPEVVTFAPTPGQITYVEMGMACKGDPAPKDTNVYASVGEAVQDAFADAIKLPSSESNRSNHPMFGPGAGGKPMGPPPKG